MKTRVVHCKKEPYDVYIGRSSNPKDIWGNPFVIGRDGNRDQVIEKYRQYLLTNHALRARIEELRGKVLGCWCKPNNACHGDVIVEFLENMPEALGD